MFDDADSKLSSNDHFQKAVAARKGRLIAPQLEHLVEFLQNPFLFYSLQFSWVDCNPSLPRLRGRLL